MACSATGKAPFHYFFGLFGMGGLGPQDRGRKKLPDMIFDSPPFHIRQGLEPVQNVVQVLFVVFPEADPLADFFSRMEVSMAMETWLPRITRNWRSRPVISGRRQG